MNICPICKKYIWFWQRKDIRYDMFGAVEKQHKKCAMSGARRADYIDWDAFEESSEKDVFGE